MSIDKGHSYSRRRRIAIIVTLGLLTGVGPFTIDLYLPAFPALKSDLVVTDAQVQLTLSATTAGFALGQLFVGPLSDRFGRRLPLVACCTLHIISSILVALSPGIGFLTVMRLGQGVGAAGGAVVALAMTRDLFSGRRLVVMLSRLALVSGLAPILAPIIGSWMMGFMPWRGVFWALALYGCTLVVLILVCTVETRPSGERSRGGIRPLLEACASVVSDRQSLGAMLIAAFAFGALFSYVSSSSVLLQEVYGLSAQGFGTVFAVCSCGVFAGVQSGSRLAQRIGPGRVLIAGTALLVLSPVAVLIMHATAVGYLPLVPALFACTLGFGLCVPCHQVLMLEHHRQRSGMASSLMGASAQVVGSVVGPCIGLVPMTSAVPMALSMLVCGALATAVLWGVLRPLRLSRSLV